MSTIATPHLQTPDRSPPPGGIRVISDKLLGRSPDAARPLLKTPPIPSTALFTLRHGALRLSKGSAGFFEIFGLDAFSALGRPLEQIFPPNICRQINDSLTQFRRRPKLATISIEPSLEDREFVHAALAIRRASGTTNAILVEASVADSGRSGEARPAIPAAVPPGTVKGELIYSYDTTRCRELDVSSLLGYPFKVNKDDFSRICHPADMMRVFSHRRALRELADNDVATITVRLRDVWDRWRWVETREGVVGRLRDGSPRRIVGIARDVTGAETLDVRRADLPSVALDAETKERRRIARELHDSTAQHLVAIDLGLSRLERNMKTNIAVADVLGDIRTALRAAHREIRTFSYLLHPPSMGGGDLQEALRTFLSGFASRTGMEVKFAVSGPEPVLGPVGRLALFRVAQEAMMNAHVHARAKVVEVLLMCSPMGSLLQVTDDGVGMSPTQIELLLAKGRSGVGIASMKARMDQLGGEFEMVCSSGRGLQVRASLPDWQTA